MGNKRCGGIAWAIMLSQAYNENAEHDKVELRKPQKPLWSLFTEAAIGGLEDKDGK